MGIRDFLTMHDGHCEYSAFLTFFGIVAFIIVLIMYLVLQIPVLNNLVILFGISLLSGIGAVIVYRWQHKKFPFG